MIFFLNFDRGKYTDKEWKTLPPRDRKLFPFPINSSISSKKGRFSTKKRLMIKNSSHFFLSTCFNMKLCPLICGRKMSVYLPLNFDAIKIFNWINSSALIKFNTCLEPKHAHRSKWHQGKEHWNAHFILSPVTSYHKMILTTVHPTKHASCQGYTVNFVCIFIEFNLWVRNMFHSILINLPI